MAEQICSDFPPISWTKLLPKQGPEFERMEILLQDPGLQAKRQELEPLRDALVSWLLQKTTHEDHDAAAGVFDSLAVDSQSLFLPAHYDRWPQICSPSAFASAEYAQIDFKVLSENTSWRSLHLDMLGFSY